MAKGIQGTVFLQDPLETGQLVKLPDLSGCPVYGLKANGKPLRMEADMTPETRSRLKTLGKESGVKWVIGRVIDLGEGGMSWCRIYVDEGKNGKKSSLTKKLFGDNRKTMMDISKTDPLDIKDNYELTDYLPVCFPKQEDFTPVIYWIEPFLVYPELHRSKSPKGFFLFPIDKPRIYEAFVSGYINQHRFLFRKLTNEKPSSGPDFQYGDTMTLDLTTVGIPDHGQILVEIYNSDDVRVSECDLLTYVLRQPRNFFGDTGLNLYGQNLYKSGTLDIPLDIRYKAAAHKKGETDHLRVKIIYKPYVPHRPEGYTRDKTVVERDNIPDIAPVTPPLSPEMPLRAQPKTSSSLADPEVVYEGYVSVLFKDTRSYIDEREITISNMMVEPGRVSLVAPENNPCCYTRITAERVNEADVELTSPQTITLFDEDTRAENTPPPEIHLISGDSGNARLKLKVNLDTRNRCKCGKHVPEGESVFLLDEETARAQGLSDYKIRADEMELKPRYIYVKDAPTPFPLNYLCIKNVEPMTYFVPIETCRYRNVVKVSVYPDIEFSVVVKYNAEKSMFLYKTPNFGYRTSRDANYNRRLNGKYQSERGKTHDKSYEFEYAAGYKYNGQEHIFDSEKGIPLLNAVCFFMDAYKIIREYLFADEADETEERISKDKEPVRVRDSRDPTSRSMSKRYRDRKGKGIPVKLSIARPSFSGGLHARFSPASTPGKSHLVGCAYSLDFKAEPLFKIEGKLDLLFYAQFIPGIGQALTAINKVVEGINLLTLGAVRIDYYLNIASNVAFNLDWSGVEYHGIDGWTGGKEISARAKVLFWVEAGLNLNADLQGGSFDAQGEMRGEASFDIDLSYDRLSHKCDASVNFKGLKVKIWLKLKVKVWKQDIDGPPPEPDTPPDHVKTLIKGMRRPWKINII